MLTTIPTAEEIRAEAAAGQCPCCGELGHPLEQASPAFREELAAAEAAADSLLYWTPSLPPLCWACQEMALVSGGPYGERARAILRRLSAEA